MFGLRKMSKPQINVALAGNPNVGKSTVFNALTGLRQHTGNWTGKTVDLAECKVEKESFVYKFIDIPGTYSLNPHSKEEAVARDFICFGDSDKVAVVCDATSLERNLYLALQILETGSEAIACINLLDEARKKGIRLNIALLEKELGVPVVGMTARNGEGIEELLNKLQQTPKSNQIEIKYNRSIEGAIEYILPSLKRSGIKGVSQRWLALRLLEEEPVVKSFVENNNDLSAAQKEEIFKAVKKARRSLEEKGELNGLSEAIASTLYEYAYKINNAVTLKSTTKNKLTRVDNIFTKRFFSYFFMLLMLSLIFYITIVGANYPSQWLSALFGWCEIKLLDIAGFMKIPGFLQGMLVTGGFRVMGWVISVMLPPMAIFFPCFSILEELGVLPRIAYALDNSFRRVNACGKQALTTCMGFGCNCVGISGARIIDSKREQLLAILTNSLTICNGRFPAIIALISVFFVSCNGVNNSALGAIILSLVIVFSLGITLLVSRILSKTLLKGESSHYILEIPPFRRPKILKVLKEAVLNRTLVVLLRAVVVAFPAGVIIWLFANVQIFDVNLLDVINRFFDPLGNLMGMDGETVSAFFLGVPANEIVLPIALMSYLGTGEVLNIESAAVVGEILKSNGWSLLNAICFVVFSVVHFPCATALFTIYKETKSVKWTVYAFAIPTIIGVVLCSFINILWYIFNM